MKEKLIKLLENSYSIYSNVKVSSILIAKDGKEINGVNVENAAFPSGTCAERSAMFSAISQGYKPKDFKEIHVASNLDRELFPCAGCRQVMVELLGLNCKVVVWGPNSKTEVTVGELVPYAVGNKELF